MSDEILAALRAADLPEDESDLRVALEARVPTWTLCRLSKPAANRWKARYRLMMGAEYFDAQSAAEAYARALLATLALTDNGGTSSQAGE